jgi:hypothetical protein
MPTIKNLDYCSEKDTWTLRAPYVRDTYVDPVEFGYSCDLPHDADLKFRVTVPFGFCTDGVSTPWYLKWLINTTGDAFPAALVHDFLYWNHKAGRPWADAVFQALMKEDGVPWWKRQLCWLGVRLCGRSRWEPK